MAEPPAQKARSQQRPKPRKRKQIGTIEQTKIRAQFIVDLIGSRMLLSYEQRIAETRRAFGCGKGAAEQLHALAKEWLAEAHAQHAMNAVVEMTLASREREEMAHRRGDLRTANRIMMDRAKLLGIGAPDRVEVTKKIDPSTFDEMTDEELEIAARLDRKRE